MWPPNILVLATVGVGLRLDTGGARQRLNRLHLTLCAKVHLMVSVHIHDRAYLISEVILGVGCGV